MMHLFPSLAPDYAAWIDHAQVRPEVEGELDEVCRKALIPGLPKLKAGCDELGVPLVWAAASFYREAGYDFRDSPAQGDRWDARSIHVPAGLGPYRSFTDAQVAAYRIDGIEKYAGQWTLELALFLWELFNGFGYRDRWRIRSPYDVAGTTIQQKGKYIADGQFSYGVMDQQLGCLAMYLGMVALDASLALPRQAGVATVAAPAPQPSPSPIHVVRDVAWTQAALDKVMTDDAAFLALVKRSGIDVLRVDGDLGKKTRTAVRAFEQYRGLEVDAGLPGSQVVGELDKILGDGWTPPSA